MDSNTVIYGHAMKNNTMFGELKRYKEKPFFDKNKTIQIHTPKGDILKYTIISVYTTVADSNYIQTEFNSKSEFINFQNHILDKSLFESGEVLSSEDKILTMSTCSYEFEDARTVIHAKLIR